MKKYFILFCVLFSFAGLKSQAQDVIMTRDYSVVNALVSEIGDDYVTYRAFDNQNGPNIRISTKNVFKITFQNGSEQFFDASGKMVETKAEAQSSLAAVSDSRAYAPSRSALLERAGNNLIFQDNGSTWALTPEMVSPEFWNNYRSASVMQDAGEWLWAIGAGAFLGYILGWGIAGAPASMESSVIAVSCASISLIAVGVPLDIVGRKKLDRLGDEYNRQHGLGQPSVSLTIGAQQYGVGLALRF